MNNSNIKRFYIMPEVWVTVTQSQVFNWIKLINEKNISTDCISITNTKSNSDDVRKIENSISGKFVEIHDFKRLILNDIYFSIIIFKFYIRNVFKYDKIIFQTRLSSLGIVFALLRWLPKISFIYEGRGAGNEERNHVNKQKAKNIKLKIKDFFAETHERLTLRKSDKIICVSNALKNYYIKKFKLESDKFKVFPGAADQDLFFYDNELKNKFREQLNFKSDDIIIVYSGRLEMKWEIPDKIFEFFKNLNVRDERFRLLLVTPDVDIANEFISFNKLQQLCRVRKSSFEEVNNYLICSDAGILLREDIVMNNVASPTKFAEYVMAGLPVIISNSIHDFSKDIDESNYGVVVSNLDGMSDMEYERLKKSLNIQREKIAQWGRQKFSKESFISEYILFLKNC